MIQHLIFFQQTDWPMSHGYVAAPQGLELKYLVFPRFPRHETFHIQSRTAWANCLCLPKTERFPRIEDFQGKNKESPKPVAVGQPKSSALFPT